LSNPNHVVTITGGELPENGIVEINVTLFENIKKLPKSAIVLALLAFSNFKQKYRLHYKKLMAESGYSRPQAMSVLRTLTNKKILRKIGNGSYLPNMRGEMLFAYRWEINHIQNCSQEQIRVWLFFKLYEGVQANTTRFAKVVGMHRTSVARALNDRKDGRGLLSLGLVIRHEGRFYTPTGLPKNVASGIPLDDDKGPIPEGRHIVPHAGEDTSTSVSSSNFFRCSRTKTKLKNSYFLGLLRLAGSRQQKEMGSPKSSVKVSRRPVGRSLTTQSIGENLKDVRTIDEFLIKCPTINHHGKEVRRIFKEFSHLGRLVIIEAVKNALRWAVTKAPHLRNVVPFLRKWLENPGNVTAAGNFVRKRFGGQFLDPDQPTTLFEQLEELSADLKVCGLQTFEKLPEVGGYAGEPGHLFC